MHTRACRLKSFTLDSHFSLLITLPNSRSLHCTSQFSLLLVDSRTRSPLRSSVLALALHRTPRFSLSLLIALPYSRLHSSMQWKNRTNVEPTRSEDDNEHRQMHVEMRMKTNQPKAEEE